MKAAIVRGLQLMAIENWPDPEVKPGSILIKVAACAVCGSDIRILETGNHRVKYPAIIGHEMAGEIVETGTGVTDFKVGDKISTGADVPCGKCYWCLNGMGNCCDENYAIGYQFPGGFAEYCLLEPMVVHYGPIAIVPKEIDLEQAALAEPLACCINGLERVSFAPGKSVLVIGAGPIGLLLIQTARVFGSTLTVIADNDSERLKLSEAFQPDFVINSRENDLIDRVMEITKGRGVDIVLTACPSPDAQEQAIGSVAKRGFINFFGGLSSSSRKINISSNQVHYKEICLTGSHGSTPVQHSLALKLIASKRINVSKLITHRFPLEKIHTAFDTVKERKGLKVIIQMNKNIK